MLAIDNRLEVPDLEWALIREGKLRVEVAKVMTRLEQRLTSQDNFLFAWELALDSEAKPEILEAYCKVVLACTRPEEAVQSKLMIKFLAKCLEGTSLKVHLASFAVISSIANSDSSSAVLSNLHIIKALAYQVERPNSHKSIVRESLLML